MSDQATKESTRETPVKELAGQVAIVTGAGHPKGIGWATALKLAQAGAAVVVTDLKQVAGDLELLAEDIREQGGKALAVAVDVTSSTDVDACVIQALEAFGRIDILVNNAGVGGGGSEFLKVTQQHWDLALGVNVMGVVNCSQAVIPRMLTQGGGVIVNTASLCGLGAIPEIPAPYTASKFAVVGLTKALALEYADQNIRCNAVCPGAINTQMREHLIERLAAEHNISLEAAEQMENATIALKRGAEPAEVADAVVYLASPRASYMTGVALPVAGGMAPGI